MNVKLEGFTLLLVLSIVMAPMIFAPQKKIPLQKKITKAKTNTGSATKKLEKALAENPGALVVMALINLVIPLILSLIFWIVFFFRWVDEKKFFPPSVKIIPPWGILDIFRVILFFVVCQIYLSWSVRQLDLTQIDPIYRSLLFNNLVSLLALGFLLFLVLFFYKGQKRDLGFHTQNLRPCLSRGIMGYFMITPLIWAAVFLSTYLGGLWGIQPTTHPIVDFASQGDDWLFFYLAFMACILAPLVEETFFRAFAYPALRKKLGKWPAMVLVTLLFAGLHPGFSSFFPIFVLGFYLAYLYEKTGSILPCIAVHCLNNSLSMAKLFFLKSLM